MDSGRLSKELSPFNITLGGVMNQDVILMDMLGSAFQIVSFSAIGLFVAAVVVVVWLCCTEDKSSDK
jgi:hypothetical protein